MKINRPSKLLIFETHPVQYRAPVYQKLGKTCPDQFIVVYASDYSLNSYFDPEFSTQLSWDIPLLDGYSSIIIEKDSQATPQKWNDLKARNLYWLLRQWQPAALLLTSFNYRCDMAAYLFSKLLGIPIWLRMETQDEAFERSFWKSHLRAYYYRTLYFGVERAFPIGELNRQHFLNHGLRKSQLQNAHYCTPDQLALVSIQEKRLRRQAIRDSLGIQPKRLVIAFYGKFIAKKDPLLLPKAVQLMPHEVSSNLDLLFVGSGELEQDLRQVCKSLKVHLGVESYFPGFINQSELADWYLCADVVVLPSRRMGETWGLVVNEALQAGCSAIVSEAVGCHADFGGWERVRTIPVGDASALASAITELSHYPHDFDWARVLLRDYSIDAAANSLAAAINTL